MDNFQVEQYEDENGIMKYLISDNSGNIWRDGMLSMEEVEQEFEFIKSTGN